MFISAWTLTEIVRYLFYALVLVRGDALYIIKWLRFVWFL